MKARTLGRLDLPDEMREGVLLDLHSLARELGGEGEQLWRAVDLAISERSSKVGSKVMFVAGGAGEREPLLVATALACGAAKSGVSVMLVDTGLLEARIGLRELGAHAAGFAELVRGGDPRESFHESGIPHLVVVPAGRAAGGLPAARPSEEELREALDVLRAHAELVLVPGSLWQGDEASMLLSHADVHLGVRSPSAEARGGSELPNLEAPGVVTGVRAVMIGVIAAEFETPRGTASDTAGGAGRRDALRAAFGAGSPRDGSVAGDDELKPEDAVAGASPAQEGATREDRPVIPAPQPARSGIPVKTSCVWKGSAVKGSRLRKADSREPRRPLRTILVAGAVVALAGAAVAVAWMHPDLIPFGSASRQTAFEPQPASEESAGVSSSGTMLPDASLPEGHDTAGLQATSADSSGANPPTSPASAETVASVAATVMSGPQFVVIVASFKVRSNAEKLAEQLREEGHGPAVWQVDRPGMGRWFRVVADTLATKAMADSVARSLREAGTWRDAVVVTCAP